MQSLAALVLSLFMLPVVAAAQEVVGTITGTLNGEAHDWYLTARDGVSQSDARDMGGFLSVTLLGHGRDDTILSTEGALIVSWTAMGDSLLESELRYMPGTSMGEAYTPGDTPPAVTVDRLDIADDGSAEVAGTVSGVLGWTPGFGAVPDMTNTVTIEARFEGTLPPPQE